MLNRDVQHRLLMMLADSYPTGMSDPSEEMGLDPKVGSQNLYYLAEHGLITVDRSMEIGPDYPTPAFANITARGLDFLADDGGLSAILGVVTIKLHEDTIKGLIEAKVAASDLADEEKTSIRSVIRGLPAEATKRLTEKLLDLGMESLPAAGPLLRTFLQSLGG